MDLLHPFHSLFFMILLFTSDVSPLTSNNFMSAAKAQIGKPFTISCNFSAPVEVVNSVELCRGSDRIVVFPVLIGNVSILDKSLVNRTIATKPTSNSSQATLQFVNIVCSDKDNYQWKIIYFNGLDAGVAILNFSFPIIVPTAFNTTRALTYAPNTGIVENTEVTFTCSADVGNEPVGVLGWYYYLNNLDTVVVNVSNSSVFGPPVASDCSYNQTSVLKLTLTKELNNIVVRCTIQQNKLDQFGDGYTQTSKIVVQYKPRIDAISKSESGRLVEGHASLQLTCTADAVPDPSFYWVLPDVNGTVVQGSKYTLTNLTLNDTGVYTCIAYNTINGQNYSVNTTTFITVDSKTTTPLPTTTTTSTSTVSGTSVTVTSKAAASTADDSKSKTNSIIIGVVVGVGVAVIIIVIIIVVLLRRGKSKPKIEEPPEKPRNNRPDLVIADNKNFGPGYALNSSFNNSFDSSSDYKLRNEDAINNGYDNLQFDDKPRSRKPIQLLDNSGSSSMFSNVTMLKV